MSSEKRRSARAKPRRPELFPPLAAVYLSSKNWAAVKPPPPEESVVLPLRNQRDVVQVISLHDVPTNVGDFVILDANSHQVTSRFEPFFVNFRLALDNARRGQFPQRAPRRGFSFPGSRSLRCNQCPKRSFREGPLERHANPLHLTASSDSPIEASCHQPLLRIALNRQVEATRLLNA